MKRLVFIIVLTININVFAQSDLIWKKPYNEIGTFYSAIQTTDGFIMAGDSYIRGNYWTGVTSNGSTDAIIIKYDNNCNVVWKKHFGGRESEVYNSITAVSDGFVAAGEANYRTFGTGDWEGITATGDHNTDRYGIVVKFNNLGNVVWKKHFGGDVGQDFFNSVTTVSDGIVAAGYATPASFGTGDWTGIQGNGFGEAIVVKYNNNGDIVWKKNFGGVDFDYYESITAVSDGIIAVGRGWEKTFDTGDWSGISGKGSADAIIVKYDNDGNVVWKKNFGGGGGDLFSEIMVVSDGVIAVGYSQSGSFDNGDWAGITGKGNQDAIIVKYNNNGDVIWKKNFGGSYDEEFTSVTATSDGIIAAGKGYITDIGTGDWAGFAAKGQQDAFVVKYDNNGNVVWKKNFGGNEGDYFFSVTAVSDGIMAAGYSNAGSFGNDDWANVTGKGGYDATIVKYLIPVISIINLPTTATINVPLTLTGTVAPSEANQNITWSIVSAGTTGAVLLNGNELFATAKGTVAVLAIVANGTALGTDYTQAFYITVSETAVNINEVEVLPTVISNACV